MPAWACRPKPHAASSWAPRGCSSTRPSRARRTRRRWRAPLPRRWWRAAARSTPVGPTSGCRPSPAARPRGFPFSKTLRRVGERGLLQSLKPFVSPAGRRLLIGARENDDAAVWRSEAGAVVGTIDTMVEGIDFRLDWPGLTFRAIGRRLMTINLSDLAAMGAEPRHALISLALPGRLAIADVTDLYRGISERAQQYGCTVAGGDLSGTDGPLVLTAALYGTIAPGSRPLRRAGARAGWALAVTGRLGLASAGVGFILPGKRPPAADRRRFVQTLSHPRAPGEAAKILQGMGGRVAGDINDVLYREIERIAQPGGLGATVESDRNPPAP